MHGRMYDPVLGQFLSPDPILQAPVSQGFNRFAYTFNNPLSYVDPSGFEADPTTVGIDVGIGVAFGTGLGITLAQSSAGGVAVGVDIAGGASSTAGIATVSGGLGVGIGSVANTAFLTGLHAPSIAPHTVETSSRAANVSGQGTPTLGRASQAMGTAAVTEMSRAASAPAPNVQGGQAQVDAAYRRSGADWGRGPQYDKDLRDYGSTGAEGVKIGPAALRSQPTLASTIVHEGVHVGQLKRGNFPHWRSDVGAAVSEAEAYREELLFENVQRTGLSHEEQNFVAGEYKKQLLTLEQMGSRGDYYLRRILIDQDFTLKVPDVRVGALPSWIK